jgi:hypothetical protein
MASDVRISEIHELLERFQVHYEVCPYFVFADQSRAGAPHGTQKVQAGFDVNLYGFVASTQLPLFGSEGAHTVLNDFGQIAREIEMRVGNRCTVEIVPFTNSLVLDPQQHFRPQGMLQIRIRHVRGLEEPAGASEDGALKAVQELMRELEIKRR